MKLKSILAAVAAAMSLFLVAVSPAQAAVRYQFSIPAYSASFDLTLPAPPPSGQTSYEVTSATCFGSTPCTHAMFLSDYFGGDYVGVGAEGNPLGDVFQSGAWYANGTYTGLYNDATLTVSGVTAAPEPGTWAMLILGFGIAGTALRRRRRAQPEAQPAFA